MKYEEIKDQYSNFIIKRTYSRFIPELNRRETWDEIIDRYAAFLRPMVPTNLLHTFEESIQAIRDKKIMPSMRLLWTAGKAVEKDNVCAFNCAYTAIDNLKVFSEIMYLLMNGLGVGFSVERQFIAKLPEISPVITEKHKKVYIVNDSKEGWALTFNKLIKDWYQGIPSIWDVERIRPKGSLIKTFGGRASGPEVLVDLFIFTKNIIFNALGRKLNSKEIADIVCKIADIVIAGGVRRSATICFSNLSDQRMRHFKEGQFWIDNPQRSYVNVSVAYTEKPDIVTFMEECKALIQSNSGERGIINVSIFPDNKMRLNPCAERVLKDKQLCNLTEVIIDKDIEYREIIRRVKFATLLGTIQASLTKFNTNVLSKEWVKNTKEDAMLGVSLTGTSNREWTVKELSYLKSFARDHNEFYAKYLGINPASGITCNKPSGTVSQVVGCSSGIHPDFAEYYIRRVRVNKTDPLCLLLIHSGIPHHPEVGTTFENASNLVFEFPMKGSAIRTKNKETALSQLEYYKLFKDNWCDDRGNPSCTIYVKNDEWLQVFNWVYENWDSIGGLSFLPTDNGVYQLAPYEEITKEEFEHLCYNFHPIDFSKLSNYEKEDLTLGAKEYSCSSGSCDLI